MGEHNIQGLPFHTDITNVILYHHENADGTGPFGKKWEETPLFARIIHLCDLLDVVCRTQTFTTATWEKAVDFLQKVKGCMIDEEFTTMKDHASYTYYILSEIDDFEELRDWAAFHHERLDGTGYPFGKTAADLNTQERMMACVDIYQALTESRPYKQGMSHEKACGILKSMADKGWLDAEVVS